MPSRAQIEQWRRDPAAFRAAIIIRAADGPRPFTEVMAPHQAEDFKAFDPSFIALRDGTQPPVVRFWAERTKGGSKDTDCAIQIIWLLAFSQRSLTIQIGAADQDQADELRLAAREVVTLNPWLSEVIQFQRNAIVNPRTENRADILPFDIAGSHGARPDLTVINEITHHPNREFADNLFDNAEKVRRGVVVVLTNAGFNPSWQYDLREIARESDRWYFSQLTDPPPWIDAKGLQERRLSTSQNRYDRLWRGIWTSDHGDALHETDINAAFDCRHLNLSTEESRTGWTFAGAVDIGISKDSSVLCIVGKDHCPTTEVVESETEGVVDQWGQVKPRREWRTVPASNRYRVVQVEVWRPGPGQRVSLEEIRRAVLRAHERWGLSLVGFDPYAAQHLQELLERDCVPVKLVHQTGGALTLQASTFIETFQQRQIDVDPECGHRDDLLSDIRSLQLQERSYGVRLMSPRRKADSQSDVAGTGHGDAASALSIGLPILKDLSQSSYTYADFARLI